MPRTDMPFTEREYRRRLDLAHAAMARAGLDLLIVTDPSNQHWLSGYDGWSFYVHQAVLLPAGEDPIWWGRRQDGNGAVRTVWMPDARVWRYADHFVQSTERHPMQDLAAKIADAGLAHARIGVESDNYYYSAKADQSLRAALPGSDLIDATALINRERAIKSAEELAFMRKAARITDKIMMTAIERAEVGLPKNRLVAEVMREGVIGVEDAWGDYPAIVPLLPSGSDAAAPHLTWDGAPMQAGMATFFELSGCYRRYHAPLSRSVFLGRPDERIRHAGEALVEGLEAGIEAARAGERACDIARALAAVMSRHGIERADRCGYPIGLSYPPDWGERTISLRDSDEAVLQAGMTFHFMPGLWMDDWGLETTESILIRESGAAECLCSVPRHLFVKP